MNSQIDEKTGRENDAKADRMIALIDQATEMFRKGDAEAALLLMQETLATAQSMATKS